jgi:hypothetical protein
VTVAAGALACLLAGCNALLDVDKDFTVGPPAGSGGGSSSGGGDCPSDEQDNDGNGSCEPACDADTCFGHGTCDDSSGVATCTCDFRFSGDVCATCAEAYAGPDCAGCAAGYQDPDDDGTCLPGCEDTSCSTNGSCDDSSGAVVCSCNPDFSGDDCATPCPTGTAGAGCGFRLIYGLDIPAAAAAWATAADVPYDVDDAAATATFDRVAYRLIVDDQQVWVEMDPFTNDATELGVPVDALHDVAITNVTVASYSANLASISTPTDGNVEMWSNCYSAGPNGVFDHDDDLGATDCYGSLQVHADQQIVLAFNRWAASGTHELGIGPSPAGNPDYTFQQNADDYTERRLEVYVREP